MRPSTPGASAALPPPPPPRLLAGGAIQFPGGSSAFSRRTEIPRLRSNYPPEGRGLTVEKLVPGIRIVGSMRYPGKWKRVFLDRSVLCDSWRDNAPELL